MPLSHEQTVKITGYNSYTYDVDSENLSQISLFGRYNYIGGSIGQGLNSGSGTSLEVCAFIRLSEKFEIIPSLGYEKAKHAKLTSLAIGFDYLL